MKNTSKWQQAKTWLAAKARSAFSWAKRHPIATTLFVTAVVLAIALPPLFPFLFAAPFIGPLLASLSSVMSQAPLFLVTYTAMTAAVTTLAATILVAVNAFKNHFQRGVPKDFQPGIFRNTAEGNELENDNEEYSYDPKDRPKKETFSPQSFRSKSGMRAKNADQKRSVSNFFSRWTRKKEDTPAAAPNEKHSNTYRSCIIDKPNTF